MAKRKKARKKKKSINPFKMWGSYVGLVVYTSLVFFTSQIFFSKDISEILEKILFFPSYLIGNLIDFIFPSSGGCVTIVCFSPQAIIGLLSIPVFGFLIGWGIHSGVRWIRK